MSDRPTKVYDTMRSPRPAWHSGLRYEVLDKLRNQLNAITYDDLRDLKPSDVDGLGLSPQDRLELESAILQTIHEE